MSEAEKEFIIQTADIPAAEKILKELNAEREALDIKITRLTEQIVTAKAEFKVGDRVKFMGKPFVISQIRPNWLQPLEPYYWARQVLRDGKLHARERHLWAIDGIEKA
jgi:hypothetical protein